MSLRRLIYAISNRLAWCGWVVYFKFDLALRTLYELHLIPKQNWVLSFLAHPFSDSILWFPTSDIYIGMEFLLERIR